MEGQSLEICGARQCVGSRGLQEDLLTVEAEARESLQKEMMGKIGEIESYVCHGGKIEVGSLSLVAPPDSSEHGRAGDESTGGVVGVHRTLMRLTQVVVPDGRSSVIKDTERYKACSTKVDQQPNVTRAEGS